MALNRKIAYINLSTGKVTTAGVSSELRKKYLGGRGLGALLLLNHLKPGTDPLSPDNPVVISAGLLAGTPSAASSPLIITTKSPLGNGCCVYSGSPLFTAELRWAGFDHLVVTGKSPKPVYLYINNGKVILKPAQDLKSKSVSDSQQRIREKLGERNTRVLAIGPAGENLVRFAGIFTSPEDGVSGAGVGAVFGSKNLKALAVRGTLPITLADPKASLEFGGHISQQNPEDFTSRILKGTRVSVTDAAPGRYAQLLELLQEERIDDRFGLPVAQTASLIAWIIALSGQYILTDSETDGLDISWDNTPDILKLVSDIAERRGFGATLAEGACAAAEKIGRNAGKYLVSAAGTLFSPEMKLAPELVLPASPERRLAAESLGLVDETTASANGSGIETWVKKLSLATGLEMTPAEIFAVGERGNSLEQLIRTRETAAGKETLFSAGFYSKLKEDTGTDAARFGALLADYYRQRGWNENGVPSEETLKRLGIDGEPSHSL